MAVCSSCGWTKHVLGLESAETALNIHDDEEHMGKTQGQRESRRQENRLAARTGGRPVGGSGNSWSHKGDVIAGDLHIEAKWTGKNSFSVSAALWRKLETEAVRSAKMPILAIRLDPSDLDLVVLDENDFMSVREELEQLRREVAELRETHGGA